METTIKELIISKQSYIVEKPFTIGGTKCFFFIEALDKNGCSFVDDFDENKLTKNVLVEIGICGTGETFATLDDSITIEYDFENMRLLAVTPLLLYLKEHPKTLKQEMIESIENDTFYDFIANNYHRFTKDELATIIKEFEYTRYRVEKFGGCVDFREDLIENLEENFEN
jgi:hypothetical protein